MNWYLLQFVSERSSILNHLPLFNIVLNSRQHLFYPGFSRPQSSSNLGKNVNSSFVGSGTPNTRSPTLRGSPDPPPWLRGWLEQLVDVRLQPLQLYLSPLGREREREATVKKEAVPVVQVRQDVAFETRGKERAPDRPRPTDAALLMPAGRPVAREAEGGSDKDKQKEGERGSRGKSEKETKVGKDRTEKRTTVARHAAQRACGRFSFRCEFF